MKKEVLIIKDSLSQLTIRDIETIKEQTGTDRYIIYNIDDDKKINSDIAAVVAYNNCLFLLQDLLTTNLLDIVAKAQKYIYRRDKNFIGAEAINNIKYDYKVIYPKYVKRVLICVPTYQTCTAETMSSIYNLIEPENTFVDLMFITGYTVVQARNRAVEQSIAGNFDYTLFIDSDVIIPPYLLTNLMSINADITTGYYLKKTKDKNITELYGADKVAQNSMVNIFKEELPNKPFNILGCGFGCTLIKNKVFKALEAGQWFRYIEDNKSKCSEDLYFCIKATENNFRIVADPNSYCLHVGKTIF